MTQYRRDRTPGATWFFTVALADRRASLLVDRIADLRAAFRDVRATHHFIVDATVILPEHPHCIWTLPQDDADYALRWRLVQTRFSRWQAQGELRSSSKQTRTRHLMGIGPLNPSYEAAHGGPAAVNDGGASQQTTRHSRESGNPP